jgi:hypothetical protein
MTLSIENRLLIHELLSRHGHLMDRGEFDRLDELFTPDVVYDLTDFGIDPEERRAALRFYAERFGTRDETP